MVSKTKDCNGSKDDNQQAAEYQVEFLKFFGFDDLPEGLTKKEASKLIDDEVTHGGCDDSITLIVSSSPNNSGKEIKILST